MKVSIWRDWYQNSPNKSRPLVESESITSEPISYKIKENDSWLNGFTKPKLEMIPLHSNQPSKITHASHLVDLILPTSICSSQIAQMLAESLNEEYKDKLRFASVKKCYTKCG